MEKLKKLPYVLLLTSILVGTIIGMFSNISFATYLKRTLIFYAIIFFGSHLCVSSIARVNAKQEKSNPSNIDIVIPPGESELLDNPEDEDQNFMPLDFKNYSNKNQSTKVLEQINES